MIYLLTAIGLTPGCSSTVQYSTVQYSTVQYSTVQYSTVQYSTHLHTKLLLQLYIQTTLKTSQKILIIKPTRYTNFSTLFRNKTLHVSDSSSVHHQEFFIVHTAMVNNGCRYQSITQQYLKRCLIKDEVNYMFRPNVAIIRISSEVWW